MAGKKLQPTPAPLEMETHGHGDRVAAAAAPSSELQALRSEVNYREAAREHDRRFVKLQVKANNALMAIGPIRFPPWPEENCRADWRESIDWFRDDREFCTRWVDLWPSAFLALRELGLSVGDLEHTYDPQVHDVHLRGPRKRAHALVRRLFLALYERPDKAAIRDQVVAELIEARACFSEKRETIQEYLELLASKVAELPVPPLGTTEPRTLREAHAHFVKHRDFALLLGVEAKEWYRKARERPTHSFKARSLAPDGRGRPAFYLVSELLADFQGLAGVEFGDCKLPSDFRSSLRWNSGISSPAPAGTTPRVGPAALQKRGRGKRTAKARSPGKREHGSQ